MPKPLRTPYGKEDSSYAPSAQPKVHTQPYARGTSPARSQTTKPKEEVKIMNQEYERNMSKPVGTTYGKGDSSYAPSAQHKVRPQTYARGTSPARSQSTKPKKEVNVMSRDYEPNMFTPFGTPYGKEDSSYATSAQPKVHPQTYSRGTSPARSQSPKPKEVGQIMNREHGRNMSKPVGTTHGKGNSSYAQPAQQRVNPHTYARGTSPARSQSTKPKEEVNVMSRDLEPNMFTPFATPYGKEDSPYGKEDSSYETSAQPKVHPQPYSRGTLPARSQSTKPKEEVRIMNREHEPNMSTPFGTTYGKEDSSYAQPSQQKINPHTYACGTARSQSAKQKEEVNIMSRDHEPNMSEPFGTRYGKEDSSYATSAQPKVHPQTYARGTSPARSQSTKPKEEVNIMSRDHEPNMSTPFGTSYGKDYSSYATSAQPKVHPQTYPRGTLSARSQSPKPKEEGKIMNREHESNMSKPVETTYGKGDSSYAQPAQQKVNPHTYARGTSPARSQSTKPKEEIKIMIREHEPPNTQARPDSPLPQQQQPPPKEPSPPPASKPQPLDPVTQMLTIQADILNLMAEVDKFTGYKKDKQYIYLDEMLTRNLIKLDNIEMEGKEIIRNVRKEAIKCIQKCIAVLEAKADSQSVNAQENQESQGNDAEGQTEEKPQNGEVDMKETGERAAAEQPTEDQKPEEPAPVENKEAPQAADTEDVDKKPKKATKNTKRRDKGKDKSAERDQKVEPMQVDEKGENKSEPQQMEVDGTRWW